MNFTPTEWLQIGLMNAYGFDKNSFDDRLKLAKHQYLDQLDANTAEEPAYALAIMDGLSGNNRVRVHLDATASG